MKRISFTKKNRSDNILHIETDDCVVNINVNLKDVYGNDVTVIEINKDFDDSKCERETYELEGSSFNRVIKIKKSEV